LGGLDLRNAGSEKDENSAKQSAGTQDGCMVILVDLIVIATAMPAHGPKHAAGRARNVPLFLPDKAPAQISFYEMIVPGAN
jgi:hypothetical protein